MKMKIELREFDIDHERQVPMQLRFEQFLELQAKNLSQFLL
jgi:hypothetical protein